MISAGHLPILLVILSSVCGNDETFSKTSPHEDAVSFDISDARSIPTSVKKEIEQINEVTLKNDSSQTSSKEKENAYSTEAVSSSGINEEENDMSEGESIHIPSFSLPPLPANSDATINVKRVVIYDVASNNMKLLFGENKNKFLKYLSGNATKDSPDTINPEEIPHLKKLPLKKISPQNKVNSTLTKNVQKAIEANVSVLQKRTNHVIIPAIGGRSTDGNDLFSDLFSSDTVKSASESIIPLPSLQHNSFSQNFGYKNTSHFKIPQAKRLSAKPKVQVQQRKQQKIIEKVQLQRAQSQFSKQLARKRHSQLSSIDQTQQKQEIEKQPKLQPTRRPQQLKLQLTQKQPQLKLQQPRRPQQLKLQPPQKQPQLKLQQTQKPQQAQKQLQLQTETKKTQQQQPQEQISQYPVPLQIKQQPLILARSAPIPMKHQPDLSVNGPEKKETNKLPQTSFLRARNTNGTGTKFSPQLGSLIFSEKSSEKSLSEHLKNIVEPKTLSPRKRNASIRYIRPPQQQQQQRQQQLPLQQFYKSLPIQPHRKVPPIQQHTFNLPNFQLQQTPQVSEQCTATPSIASVPHTVFVTETKTETVTQTVETTVTPDYFARLSINPTFTSYHTMTSTVKQMETTTSYMNNFITKTMIVEPTKCMARTGYSTMSTVRPTGREKSSYVDYYGDTPQSRAMLRREGYGGGIYSQFLDRRPNSRSFYINQYGIPKNVEALDQKVGRDWPKDFVIDERLWEGSPHFRSNR